LREGPVEISGASCLDELKLHPQRPARSFCFFPQISLCAFAEEAGLPENSDPTEPRNGLLEQFQALAG
jgi:hypothetical protein